MWCSIILTLCSLFITIVTSTKDDKRLLRVPVMRHPRPDPMISAHRQRTEKRGGHLSKLFNDVGCQYLINVSIGTPSQNFTVTLDTGSADLWIPGDACPSSDCPRRLFNTSASSSFESLDKPFTLAYGIGSVNGTYVRDTVSIGDATIPGQQFGLTFDTKRILTNANTITFSAASRFSRREDPLKANGLLGLGYPRLTAASGKGQGEYEPFVFNLVKQGIIDEPLFSIYLNNLTSTGWVGEILFGGIDETKFKDGLTYLPVVPLNSLGSKKRSEAKDNFYWMVQAQGITITNSTGNITLGFNTSSAFVIDTGTTLTYLPQPMAEALVTAIAGPNGFKLNQVSGTYFVNCSAAQSKSKLELIMSDRKSPISIAVPASELVIPLDRPTAAEAKTCLFGVAPVSGNVGDHMYLVGDSVLRTTYMVFDMGKNQIGLASAVGLEGKVQSTSFFYSNKANTLHPSFSIVMFIISCTFL